MYREYEGIYIGLFDTACVYCFRDAYATTLQSVQYYVNGYLQGSEVYHSGDRLVLYLNGGSATFNIRGPTTGSLSGIYPYESSIDGDTLYIGFADSLAPYIGSVTVKDFSFSFTGVSSA